MRKFTALLLSMTLFVTTLGISVANINPVTVHADNDNAWPDQPSIYGTAACVIEASTGTVLYEQKAHQQMYPASITKILTALVTLENSNLDEEVTFSEEAVYSVSPGDAHMEMQVGEVMSVQDCLYGLMLKSANEVAVGLAEHVAGSVEDFAKMMNDRAKQAGATDSNFVNPNGLHNDNHYITAYDMAMITRDAVKNPLFLSITGASTYNINSSKKKDYPIYQRHKMVLLNAGYHYDGILGGKTGFTDQSGTTLVTYAERDGMTLISVVLRSNGTNVYNDTKILLDYGFENFHLVNVSENDTRFTNDSDDYTDMLTPVFGSDNNAELSIDTNAAIVLPKEAKFSDVSSTVTYDTTNADDNSSTSDVALINYQYKKHNVGSASVVYTSNSPSSGDTVAADSPVVEDDNSDTSTSDSDGNKQSKSIFSSSLLKNIFIVVVIAVVLVVIILLIRKKQRQLNEIRARKRRRAY